MIIYSFETMWTVGIFQLLLQAFLYYCVIEASVSVIQSELRHYFDLTLQFSFVDLISFIFPALMCREGTEGFVLHVEGE